MSQSLSRWPQIKDELLFWIEQCLEFTGLAKEKLSNQRENQDETYSRVSRIAALERQHFKYRQKFINDINKYFKTNIEINFENIIKNPNYTYQTELPDKTIVIEKNNELEVENNNGKSR